MINYGNIFDKEAMSYKRYRDLVDGLLAAGKTTGPNQTEDYINYTRMNVQRMKRVEKTIVLNENLLNAINHIKGSYKLLLITEGWCGDAAQIVPVIDKLASEAPEKFELKLVLRDENLPLIDAHLTNGGRAIPVLLVLNEANELALPHWGPRPVVLQNLRAQWMKEGLDFVKTAELLHGWYAKDKTQSTQNELAAWLGKLS